MSTFAWYVIALLGYLSVGTKVAALVSCTKPHLIPRGDNNAFGLAVLLWPYWAAVALLEGCE